MSINMNYGIEMSVREQEAFERLRTVVSEAGYPRTMGVNRADFEVYEDYCHRMDREFPEKGVRLWTRDGIGLLFKNVEICPQ